MSYIVNKTDGSVLTEIVDGTVDQTATDLTLIGKNSSNYGEFFNENLIKLLENFANTSQPNNPIAGQLWFDTSEGRLKIYDGNIFKVSGGAIVSNSVPVLTQGDIWISSSTQQMYFNDGSAPGGTLVGPLYTKDQGITGLQVADIIDTNQINHTVVYLYVSQVLLGIFSKSAFTPASPIAGFSGPINIGFNVSSYGGIKFNAPVSQADALLAADNSLKTAESFLSTTGNSATNGTISIQNSTPLILGPGGTNGSSEIRLSNSTFQINSNSLNQNFSIGSLNGNGLLPSFYINGANQFIGLYTNTPAATLDVNGDTIIRGSLTVNGNVTSISSTNIEIEDKLIELGKVSNPSNATANGGGFLLEGGTDGDKTLTWNSFTTSWSSSENINVISGKNYKINGFDVLTQTTLGNTVVSSSLTSVGVLGSLQVANLAINAPSTNGYTISYVNPVTIDGDIVLLPKNAGVVNVSSKRIVNVAAPTGNNDAVNKVTLSTTVRSAPLAFSADVTGLSDPQIATSILAVIFPVSEHEENTICRIHCIDGSLRFNKLFVILGGAWTFQGNI